MSVKLDAIPSPVATIWRETQRLAAVERLTLAKLLLESVLTERPDADAAWSALGLESFQRDWIQEMEVEGEEWDEAEWLRAASQNPVFEFLKDPAEDIYSLEDGVPFYDTV